MAAAGAALGGGHRWHLPGQPAAQLCRRRRAGDVHQRRCRRAGHPQELGELPLLRGLDDTDVLTALAEQFVQQEFEAGDVLVEAGQPADQVFLIAHGKVDKIGPGKYGTPPCSTPWPMAATSATARWSSRATPGPSPPRPSPAAPC